MFRFDSPSHTYTLGDQVLPSVTQVLRHCYDFSMVDPVVLERKRTIGVAVHRAIELDIGNDLDESSIAPEVAGYLKAWRNFRAEAGLADADFGAAETPMYHPSLHFAGTPDIPACLYGKWAIVDVKTADQAHPAWSLQLAAYLELINVNTPKGQHKIEDRYSLRLRDTGEYRLDQHKDKGDWGVFQALLIARRWKEAHNK